MASSNQKGNLYDPIRKRSVLAHPEEMIRQRVLHQLIHSLGFPRSLVSVEKQISDLPHLQGRKNLPKRRLDILCFALISEEVAPLLLIECKEGKGGENGRHQALGYNDYVRAPFVAIADDHEQKLVFPINVPFIPSFDQLMEKLCLL